MRAVRARLRHKRGGRKSENSLWPPAPSPKEFLLSHHVPGQKMSRARERVGNATRFWCDLRGQCRRLLFAATITLEKFIPQSGCGGVWKTPYLCRGNILVEFHVGSMPASETLAKFNRKPTRPRNRKIQLQLVRPSKSGDRRLDAQLRWLKVISA